MASSNSGMAGPLLFLELQIRAERALLGRPPVFDPVLIADRLFGKPELGPLMRWGYASFLALVQRKLRMRPLLYGPLVALTELLVLPRIGAVPPIKRWPKGDLPLLFAHATVFALANGAAAAKRLEADRAPATARAAG
jgi:hypothetical protein